MLNLFKYFAYFNSVINKSLSLSISFRNVGGLHYVHWTAGPEKQNSQSARSSNHKKQIKALWRPLVVLLLSIRSFPLPIALAASFSCCFLFTALTFWISAQATVPCAPKPGAKTLDRTPVIEGARSTLRDPLFETPASTWTPEIDSQNPFLDETLQYFSDTHPLTGNYGSNFVLSVF